MKVLVICFFSLFFLSSIIGIIAKLILLISKDNNMKVELYDDGKVNTNLEEMYAGRLADTAVRSSVRYHKSLYKTNNNYKEYRERIKNLNLP